MHTHRDTFTERSISVRQVFQVGYYAMSLSNSKHEQQSYLAIRSFVQITQIFRIKTALPFVYYCNLYLTGLYGVLPGGFHDQCSQNA